jgi:hypothetical protein
MGRGSWGSKKWMPKANKRDRLRELERESFGFTDQSNLILRPALHLREVDYCKLKHKHKYSKV